MALYLYVINLTIATLVCVKVLRFLTYGLRVSDDQSVRSSSISHFSSSFCSKCGKVHNPELYPLIHQKPLRLPESYGQRAGAQKPGGRLVQRLDIVWRTSSRFWFTTLLWPTWWANMDHLVSYSNLKKVLTWKSDRRACEASVSLTKPAGKLE